MQADLSATVNACRAVGHAARAVAERYDWARSAEQPDAVYTTVRRRYAAQRARRPLRVGLNGLFLVHGGLTGGLEPYFHNLVTNLLRLDPDPQYVLLANVTGALEFATLRGDNLRHHVVSTTPGPLAAMRSVVCRLGRSAPGLPSAPPSARGNGLARLDLGLVHSFLGYVDPSAWTVRDSGSSLARFAVPGCLSATSRHAPAPAGQRPWDVGLNPDRRRLSFVLHRVYDSAE